MTDIPLTKAALARELGVKRQTINTWIKRGDLVFDQSGKMSVDEFNKQLGNKLHPVSKIRNEKYSPIFNKAEKDTEEADLDFHAARTIREIAEAKTAEFRLHILKNDYVEKEQVNKVIFERARQFRDMFLVCSRRIAPTIAGNSDIKEIEKILNAEFKQLLEQFAKLPVVE